MKRLLYIFIFCSFVSNAQVHINGTGNSLSINSTGTLVNLNPFFRANVPSDPGYYLAFSMFSDVMNKEIYGIAKLSYTHAGAGAIVLYHSTDWGVHYSNDSIRVDGSIIHSTNHSFYRYSSGRMILAYMTDTASIKIAYNDDNDVNFTSTATINTPAGFNIAPSPIKIQLTSYGTLIFVYYKVGISGNSSSAVIMESLDNGLTWATKSTIYTSNNAYPTGAPACRGNEVAICETHPTGNESTSKWIAVVRTEVADGGAYPMFFKSSDGGNTWTQDLTTDPGSFVNDIGTTVSSSAFSRGVLYLFLETNAPFDVILHNGTVYIVNGERNTTYGYSLKFATATPDNAYRNKIGDWERPTFIKFYNARTLGSSTDCGYPIFFKSGNDLFVSEYDVSSQSPLPGVSRRCFIETVKIPTLPL